MDPSQASRCGVQVTWARTGRCEKRSWARNFAWPQPTVDGRIQPRFEPPCYVLALSKNQSVPEARILPIPTTYGRQTTSIVDGVACHPAARSSRRGPVAPIPRALERPCRPERRPQPSYGSVPEPPSLNDFLFRFLLADPKAHQ